MSHPDDGPAGILDLSRSQALAQQAQVVAAQAPRAVIACPGAGKTRTIIDRHCGSLAGQPAGRAIASFTKVAAAQIRRRAQDLGRSDLLEHPHAIVTLDGFFWRFLVRPFLPEPTGQDSLTYRRLESWRDAPRGLRQLEYFPDQADPSRRVTLDLADFQFRYAPGDRPPAATLSSGVLPELGLMNLSSAQLAEVCQLAERKRAKLVNGHGLFTGEEVRRAADRFVSRHADRLACVLPARFSELIVDEAQDCSDTDAYLLLKIAELGLPLMVFADPDQAIYGFRGTGRPAVSELLDRSDVIEMRGNWRSSSVICALSATMRSDPARRAPDLALASHHDIGLPVHLIAQDGGAELSAFHALADEAQIFPRHRYVLAHATVTLPGVGARARRPPSNPATALVWATGILRHANPDLRTRNLAGQILEGAILRCWLPGADSATAAELREEHGIDRGHLRRLAAEALQRLPGADMRMSDWCAKARQALSSLQPTVAISRPQGAGLKTPRGSGSRTAASLAGITRMAAGTGEARTDTVHQVKGEETDAVLMLLPDDDRTASLLSRWTGGLVPWPGSGPVQDADDVAEALRVLYVAVTRARRLVALALPDRHIPAVAQFLRDRGVMVEASQAASRSPQ